jgi:hypothetical protein
MTPSLKRKLTIGVLGTALLGIAGGGAYAATSSSSSNPAQAFLDDVAGRLHVSSADLQAALKAASADQLDAAVKAGKLTQAEADAIKQKLQSKPGAGVPFFGFRNGGPLPGGPPFLGVRPFLGGPFLGGIDGVAKYLGLTAAQLKTQIGSGKSLADIAKAQGKTVAGLEAAIKDAAKTQLDAQVAAKHITQAQETKILSALDSRVGDLVQGKFSGPRKFFRQGGPDRRVAPWKLAPGG